MGTPDASAGIVRSLISARMDRLPWTRFHIRLVMALGTAWVLDGLEITLASSVAGVLTAPNTLHMSSAAVGAIATVYLVGEVVGALVFGRMSDALGRRKLFMVTLGVYLLGSGLTAATAGAGGRHPLRPAHPGSPATSPCSSWRSPDLAPGRRLRRGARGTPWRPAGNRMKPGAGDQEHSVRTLRVLPADSQTRLLA